MRRGDMMGYCAGSHEVVTETTGKAYTKYDSNLAILRVVTYFKAQCRGGSRQDFLHAN